jgi:hypothetical protein
MAAMFGPRRRRKVYLSACALAAFALIAAAPARADMLTVSVDQAKVMKLPDRVATIVIGNPLIADATLQSGGMLVITGKGFGSTNLVALDRSGHTVMNSTVQVVGPEGGDTVYVYKGVDRESYSCTPDCERRATLGDSPAYFGAVIGQTGARNSQATSGSQKQ